MPVTKLACRLSSGTKQSSGESETVCTHKTLFYTSNQSLAQPYLEFSASLLLLILLYFAVMPAQTFLRGICDIYSTSKDETAYVTSR